MLLAHISDTHIDVDRPETGERTTRVMRYLHALPQPVDAIVVTGDIADHGEVSEYQLARELLASPYPVMICPGNHDRRAAFRAGLLGEPRGVESPINARYDVAGTTFLLCDSSVPGQDHGHLAEETLRWLAAELEANRDAGPIFLAFHHPPVPFHHPGLDHILLGSTEPLAELIRAHPGIVAVLTGHAHSASLATFAGRPLLVAPGVVSTLRLPWEGPGDLMTVASPPGVAFHLLDDEGRLTSHFRVVA